MKVMNVIFSFLLILIGINSSNAQSTQLDSITIEKAIQLTLSNQPLIKEAEDYLNAAGSKIEEQKSFNYPRVDANLSYTFIAPIPSIQIPFGGNFDLVPSNNYNANISIGYLLFDFQRREKIIDLLRSNKAAEAKKIYLIKKQLVYSTVQTFYSILFLKKSIVVKSEQIADLKKHIEIAKKLTESGSATGLDTLISKVRLAGVLTQKIKIQNSLKKTEAVLQTLFNFPSDKSLILSGDFSDESMNASPDSLVDLAYSDRMELQLAKQYENTAIIQKNVAKLTDIPKVSLFGSYGLKNGYPSNLDVLHGNWTLGVSAQMPLFNGFLKKAKIETSDWQIKAAQDHINALKKNIRTEVKQAYFDFQSSRKKLKTVSTEIVEAKSALEQAKVQYKNGAIINLTLLDAQTSLTESELNYAAALYEVTIYRYKLMEALGQKIW